MECLETNVGLLKEKIVEKAKIDVPAPRLEVWNGNNLRENEDGEEIPEGEELEERLRSFDFSVKTRLRATSKIRLSEGDIVIVRAPPKAGTSRASTGIRRRSS